MGDETAVAKVKGENEYFDECNQPESNELNDEPSQQNRHSEENDPNNEDQLDEERESADDEEEDESDDDITITINDVNAAAPNSSTNQNTSFSSTYQSVNLSLNKRVPSFGPGGQVTSLNAATKPKATGLDIEAAGQYNGQSIFDLNLDSLEDKPWRKPGADITDYFNYGFTEETWKIYCDRQRRLRNEMNSNSEPNGGDRVLMPPINSNNQNGNNIVLRTFTNNNAQLTNSGPSTSGGNLQMKNDSNLISSVNENSKYGGMQMPKKAGPPPGRKQFGQIEVINSGSQPVVQTNQQQMNQQMPPQQQQQQMQQMLMQTNNMGNLQQRGLKSENFIQVIGNRPPMPVPNNNMPPFNMQPPPFGIPPNMEFHGNHPMMNPMNFPPDFMNQPPIRFPMANQMDMMGNQPPPFDDPQQANMFRDQDQDDRRRDDYSHRPGSDRPNRAYSNRDYRDTDYRRRDDYDGRSSRDKDYESASSRRRDRGRDSNKERSRSKSKERRGDKEKRRSRERSKERRSHKERDRYKDREGDSRHKGNNSSGGGHKRSKVKEEQEL